MIPTQPYHAPSFLKEVWGLYAVGVTVLLTRFIVRLRSVGIKRFQGDDFMSLAVFICYTADAVTVTLCYQYGTNVDFTPQQLGSMSKQDQSYVVFGSQLQFLAWYTYVTLVWGLKATMLFFFNRLTFGLGQQTLVKLLGIAVGVTYLAVLLTITLGCYPTQRNWQVAPYPGETCTFKRQNFYVCTILNVLTDAALLAIPLPLMWKLQVPLRKKIALSLLLSSGIFVITAAVLRIVMTLVANPSALTINRWGVRETIAGIIAVNLPVIRPVFTRRFWTKDFALSSNGKQSPGPSKPNTTDVGPKLRALRRVESLEMDSDLCAPQSHGQNAGKESVHANVTDIDSNSDSNHDINRSSEDLVIQRHQESCGDDQYKDSFEQARNMETGLSRVSVTVEKTYAVHEPRTASPASQWRPDKSWNAGWPAKGYGNRTIIEASGN